MAQVTPEELEIMNYRKHYDYTQFSHDTSVNFIPEDDFKRLIRDTFETLTAVLVKTYGPYGSGVMMSDQSQTFETKDGYNVFRTLGFSHQYKRLVYLALSKICERVNRTVGDGTTSCMLLAEKIFNNIEKLMKTSDDKRNILKILTKIENDFQLSNLFEADRNNNIIHQLKINHIDDIISMASNYDDELTTVLHEALCPTMDENGNILSLNNVVTVDNVDVSLTKTKYKIIPLPGDYRIEIELDESGQLIQEFLKPRLLRVVIYDHTFSHNDFEKLIESFKKPENITVDTLILARDFTRKSYEEDLRHFDIAYKVANGKDAKLHLYFAKMRRDTFLQEEIKDLANTLRTEIHTMYNPEINLSEYKLSKISISENNILSFYDLSPNKEYIKTVETSMNSKPDLTFIEHENYIQRLNALSLKTSDTYLEVSSNSTLESKMICDKITDCISVIHSSLMNGVVPNLLTYGHYCVKSLIDDSTDELSKNVINAICESITGLYTEIMLSKYNSEYDNHIDDINKNKARIYALESNQHASDALLQFESYDAINNEFVSSLYTSAQYDTEVIAASLSIVKYLLSNHGFIFDANYMQMHGDVGHYQL